MAGSWVTVEVDGGIMDAYVAMPEGSGPVPGVVVGMHAFGIDRFIQGKCDELAEAGYAAISPYVYHRQGRETLGELLRLPFEDPRRRELGLAMKDALRDDELERDVNATVNYVATLPRVQGRLGITGFCIGGRITYLMAAKGEFGAAAVFYGTDVGRPWGHDGPSPLELTAHIRCPVIGFFGNEDTNPSPADVDAMEAALDRHGVSYTFHRYDGAPHAFNDPFNPVRWTPTAAADCWPRLLDFFGEKLKARMVRGE